MPSTLKSEPKKFDSLTVRGKYLASFTSEIVVQAL